MTTPTTPAMTAQEALASIRAATRTLCQPDIPKLTEAATVLETALADAERRATEAEAANAVRPEYPLVCDECGRAHIMDTTIPSVTWNEIADRGDTLCAVCIDRRLVAHGLMAEAVFSFGGEGLVSARQWDDGDAAALAAAQSRLSTVEARCGRMEKGLREIGDGYYLAKDAPKRLDECVDLARSILAETEGKSDPGEKENDDPFDYVSPGNFTPVRHARARVIDSNPPAGGEGKPEPVTAENAGVRLADMLTDCADMLGRFPRELDQIDPRAWRHLLVYAPLSRSGDTAALGEAIGLLREAMRHLSHAPDLIRKRWTVAADIDAFIQQHGAGK